MKQIEINVPIPHMLSSAEREAYKHSLLQQKSIQMSGVVGQVVAAEFNEETGRIRLGIQMTDEDHIVWSAATEPKEQSISIGVKQDD